MREKIGQTVDDARVVFTLLWLTLRDAVSQTFAFVVALARRAYGASETLVGSLVLATVLAAGFIWAGSGIYTTSVVSGLFLIVLIAGGFAWVLANLPYARRIQREAERAIERIEGQIAESRARQAEFLGWSRGYSEGWDAHKRCTEYYENLGYRLRGSLREDDED